MRRSMWALPILMAGCVPLTPLLSREAELMVYPNFAEKTQSVINPNTLSTIATLDILPYVETAPGTYAPISAVTGNSTTLETGDALKLTQASPAIDPTQPFVLHRLKPQTNYRIYAQAYNSANAKISLDAGSYVDVAISNNDTPNVAQVPVHLIDTPFGAATTVIVNTEGRYDYLKGTLSLVTGNTQVAIAQTTRSNPDFTFTNLQGNTNYKVVVEAYKLGAMVASTSQTINVTNETAPVTTSVSLKIPYIVTTLAGNGTPGFVDGTGASARFNTPCAVTFDLQGNLLIADDANHSIRKVTPQGVVSVFAGDGTAGRINGAALSSRFYNPVGVTMDRQGNVYVGESSNHTVRKISAAGVVSTLAGNGTAGFNDAAGSAAMFNTVYGVAVDSASNIYTADYGNHRVRKITSDGVVTTYAGNGTNSFADGPAASAMFTNIHEIAVDSQGNLFVTDPNNARIRKITPAGVVSTFAGNGNSGTADGTGASATFSGPRGIAVDAQDNLYILEAISHNLRKITPAAVVTTIAGGGVGGYQDGTGTSALFRFPYGLAVDSRGIIYVGDENNHCIRKVQ